MLQRKLGWGNVSAIGLGALPLSVEGRPDRRQAIATIHAAMDSGMTLIDTADCYGIGPAEEGHNERLIAEATRTRSGAERVVVATKGGQYRAPNGAYCVDARPRQLHLACEKSLRALGRDVIDLYQLHAVDPEVPLLDSIGALVELQSVGKVRMVGLSNVTVEQIVEARTVATIVSVQNRLSPGSLDNLRELRYCSAVGIAFLPWGPLGGLAVKGLEPANTTVIRAIAAGRGWSPQRVCLAWHLALSATIIPIPGASRPASVLDSAAAGEGELTAAELTQINIELGVKAVDGEA